MVREAAVIQVVRTVAGRGEGKPDDPYRLVTQYWSFDGALLAERDTWREEHPPSTPLTAVKEA